MYLYSSTYFRLFIAKLKNRVIIQTIDEKKGLHPAH